jgi:hypothetical protein
MFKKFKARAKLYRVAAGGKNALVIAKSMKQAIEYSSPIAMGKHHASIITACTVNGLVNDYGAYCDIDLILDNGVTGIHAPIAF